ncbi:MAG: cytochrome C oxidase subunit IV family protein [Deltaproteobacteria bacterium]|nr:cytochrome C oxidase subunit IV family protein [Deltaproteobacteria bacterium]
MDEKGAPPKALGNGTYLLVWAGLLFFTFLTVSLPGTGLAPGLKEALPLVIATIKASLVLFFFMHLGYERGFQRVIVVLSLVTLAMVFFLVYSDVAYR